MTILSADVRLVKSAVMADVSEGGGAPTGSEIADGVSNAIFPDISELDRAGGRVSLRKVFVSVASADTDGYYGANVIVAEPPQDPRVAVTLFTNGATFDTRAMAQSRVEAYLNRGPAWGGFLYENHIAGQRVVQLFQRPGDPAPNVGQTLVLTQSEGGAGEVVQYIRATRVSSVTRTFFDAADGRDYQAAIVTVEMSDALRTDFTGSPASRTFTRANNAATVRDTVVADAGTYVGCAPLTAAASLGDFSVNARSIYTQLVPSAQTETPLADVGITQSALGYNPASNRVHVLTLGASFTPLQKMFVGGGILPGSLSVGAGAITLADRSGRLFNGTTEVGQVDYEGGVLSLSTDVFGHYWANYTVSYQPAVATRIVASSIGEYVTPESRSLSKVFTLPEVPAPMSLSVSYPVNGRWYVLRDDGTGALRGTDSSYGAGAVNRTTGTVTVTFGALPDVGGAIIYQWLPGGAALAYPPSEVTTGARAGHEIELGHQGVIQESVAVTWSAGGAPYTATFNADGSVTGQATGFLIGSRLYIAPARLVPKGTVFTVSFHYVETAEVQPQTKSLAGGSYAVSDTGSAWRLTVPGVSEINSGALKLQVLVPRFLRNLVAQDWELSTLEVTLSSGEVWSAGENSITSGGATWVPGEKIGSYSGDHIDLSKTFLRKMYLWSYADKPVDSSDPNRTVYSTSGQQVSFHATISTLVNGQLSVLEGYVRHGGSVTTATLSASKEYTADTLTLRVSTHGGELAGVRFKLGTVEVGDFYANNKLYRRAGERYNNGLVEVGTIAPLTGEIRINDWRWWQSPEVSDWAASILPPVSASVPPYQSSFVAFRTATAPVRPTSMAVSGKLADGTLFSVTADAQGKFNHARVKGRINYDAGVAELYFVRATAPVDPALAGTEPGVIDLRFLGLAGVTGAYIDHAYTATLKYNAVSYTYLPLDAGLLGIDPVRLPSDGRVPIFRPGGFAVVGHTGAVTGTVSAGQTVNCGRVRLSRVRVLGAGGAVIHSGYTADLDAGTVTFTDVAGYHQPVTVEHRIEDMAIVSDAQISGLITFTRPLTHDYPVGSHVSSALVAGDLFARVNAVYDQATWSGAWSDVASADASAATYNTAQYPIGVTNLGAVTERWALHFTSTTTYRIIGEHVGVIGTGSVDAVCEPINPATGAPYFTVLAAGWGMGWGPGAVLRFNTVGALFPVWVVRTIQQGPQTVDQDSFTLLVRGDVDRP